MPDDEKRFLLRYVGLRFEGARLPVDVLSDLPAFRDLLVAFAKEGWRKHNADRQRVPKGFDKSLAFDLVAIHDGSAVPQLNWNRQAAQAILPGFKDELEELVDQSFQDVVGLLDAAGRGLYPKSLSSEHIRALNKFGSGLRDDERIEFVDRIGHGGQVVYIDNFRRKSLITRVRETYQTRFEGIGELRGSRVSEFGSGSLVVLVEPYGEITIPLDGERILDEFDGNILADVQFELQIELDHDDRLKSVVDVFDVALIDAKVGAELEKCRVRLVELSALRAGLDNGAGAMIAPNAIAAANKLLSKRPFLARRYRIYPTEVGGVLFEFEANGWDLSVEFDPTGSLEIFGVKLGDPDDFDPLAFEDVGEDFIREFDARVSDQ